MEELEIIMEPKEEDTVNDGMIEIYPGIIAEVV